MQLDIMLTQGVDTVTAFIQAGFPKDVRNYKIAVNILNDLGISSIQIITNNPDKMEQIQFLGIVINSRIPCIPNLPERNPVVDRDLAAKRTELGHLID